MELTRRGFLKTASAVAALGVATQLPVLAACSQAPAEDQPAGSTLTEYKGYCRMCMRDGCCYIAQAKDGIVTNIEGNPVHEGNHGTMCGRGKGAIMHLYNPYRIKTPMKRTNPEKGFDVDPGWVEISWDEALEEISAKFKEILENDPNELVFVRGFSIYDTINSNNIGGRFSKTFGTANEVESNGSLCAVHYATCMVTSCMPVTISDEKYAKYTVSIGRTAGASHGSANGACRNMVYSRENGCRQIIVDPRCSFEASQGEWVPIKPGTDLEFMLALINVMIYENGGYDVDFLKNRSNASYLLMEDGFYMRGADNKPLLWDLADGKAKVFDDETLTDPALEGEFEVEGQKCRPSFEWVRDSMKDYTPEWAEAICTIPAAKIREIANDLIENACIGQTIDIDGHTFPYRPAAVLTNRGICNHENGSQADLAGKIINELLGNLEVPGGTQSSSRGKGGVSVDENGVVKPFFEAAIGTPFVYPPVHFDMKEFYPHRHSMATQVWKTIVDGPETYGMNITPKAFFVCGGNPINSVSMPKLAAEAFMKVPFVASFAYHMDEVAMLSDILIPEDCMLEMESMHKYTGSIENFGPDNMNVSAVMYRNPVPRVHDTRNANDVILEIFDRCGLTPKINESLNGQLPAIGGAMAEEYMLDLETPYTIHDIYERGMKSAFGEEMGMDWFIENGLFKTNEGVSEAETYADFFWHGKVRSQFYFHSQKESGAYLLPEIAKVPHEFMGIEDAELEKYYQGTLFHAKNTVVEPDAEYDMLAFNYKIPLGILRVGSMDQNPWIGDWNQKHNPFYNSITIHPDAAAAKGLAEGDTVVIESRWGKTQGYLHVTELLHPETIGVPGATGRQVTTLGEKLAQRVHWNSLTCGLPGASSMSPITGACENTVRVKIYKA